MLVDTLGLVLSAVVHAGNVQDRDGAKQVLAAATWNFARLKTIWADAAYAGQLIAWMRQYCLWALQIVPRRAGESDFVVQPKRWIIERTFAWLDRYRRLSKDYEYDTHTSETMIYVAMTHLILRRLHN